MTTLTRVWLKNTRNFSVKIPLIYNGRRREFSSIHANLMSQPKSNTEDENEIRNFSNLADRWWDDQGEFKALHTLNKLRVPFVRDGLLNAGKINQNKALTGIPLEGMKILDVGCGGGIMCEPLSRLGADVVGLDASKESIASAKLHSKRMIDGPKYVCEAIEDHARTHNRTYDAVILSEVLEHVTRKDECLQLCSDMLKPWGSIFITTISKTILSYMGCILAAEYLLRFIPRGTHQWDKFITPKDLQNKLKVCGCNTRLVHGMYYDVFCNKWHWTSNSNVNFALHALKQNEEKSKNFNTK